jgi:hypothetical protein
VSFHNALRRGTRLAMLSVNGEAKILPEVMVGHLGVHLVTNNGTNCEIRQVYDDQVPA